MTLREFDRLLLTHGADRRRWPAVAAAAAAALIEGSGAARRALATAAALDAALAMAEPWEPPTVEAILLYATEAAQPLRRRQPAPARRWPAMFTALRVSALAASIAGGFVWGADQAERLPSLQLLDYADSSSLSAEP